MKTTYPHISSDGGTVTIEARTMAEADAAAHEALGPGWSTKSVRRLRKGGVGGFFAIEVVELIAEPAGRSGNGNGVSDEMASAEDLLRELTHNGGAFATRLIDRLAEPLDDEMTIARLLATTDAPSRSDELARVMSQLGLDRVASDEPAASLAALPDAPTFSDHSGTSRTAELPVLDADVEIGACVDADLFRPQVVAPLLVVAAEGPVGTIETIASNGGRLVATNDRAPATSAPTPPAPAAAPPANITPAPDVAPTPSTAHAAEAVGAAIDVAVEPAPVAQPVAPEVAEPAAVTAPTQPPPPAPPPRPPQPPAWVEPSNPLLAPPAAGTAPVTEPIVKALGEPAMPLADTVLAPSVAEAPTDAIDRDFVIALALGQPDEINASIPDELPSFEPAPAPAPAALAAVSMDLPLAKINPFREQLAVADEPLAQHTARVAAPIEVVLPHAPRRDDALVDTAPTTPPSEPREDAVNEQTARRRDPPFRPAGRHAPRSRRQRRSSVGPHSPAPRRPLRSPDAGSHDGSRTCTGTDCERA